MGFTSELESAHRGAGAADDRRPSTRSPELVPQRVAATRRPARGDRLHPLLDHEDGPPDQRHPEALARGPARAEPRSGRSGSAVRRHRRQPSSTSSTKPAASSNVNQPLPAITSDRLALEQVFGNLFDNAVKYRSPGAPRPVIDVSAEKRPQGAVVIEVADNGRGIARRTTSASSSCSGAPARRTSPARASASPMCAPWCAGLAATSRSTPSSAAARPFDVTLPRNLRPH